MPYEYQQRVLEKIKDKRTPPIFLPPGAGKTKITIDYLREKPGQRFIVTTPSGVPVWQKEIWKWAQEPSLIVEGGRQERIRRLRKTDVKWLIVSYPALRALQAFMSNRDSPDIVVLDESHKIKNPNAQITKVVHTFLKDADVRILLSGTPWGQNPIDIWSQIYVLDHGRNLGNSFYQFRRRHFIPDSMGWSWTIRPQSLRMINTLINEMGVTMREEELDLPPKTFGQEYVDPTPWQKRNLATLYHEFQAFSKGGEIVVDTQWAMVKIMKMRQVCSGFLISDPDENGNKRLLVGDSDKYEWLLEKLREFLPTMKVVVWCAFRYEVKRISEMLRKAAIGHTVYWGGLTNTERSEAENSFQVNPGVKVFVGQVRAGGEAITLSKAPMAIYFSNDRSLVVRHQSERRTCRIGSEEHKRVHYIDVMTRGTIEEGIYEGLCSKQLATEVAMFRHLIQQILGR